MKLKQPTIVITVIKIVLVCFTVLLFTGCSSTGRRHQQAIQAANDSYRMSEQAETAGLGEGANLDEQAIEEHAAQRIYYFDFDSNVVHESDKLAIGAQAHYLIAHPHAKVLLEGHTDPRGSREYNIGLGERRAKAVATILKTNGVNADQVRIVSYGAQKLAAPGRTELDYQKDRRVVLVYLQH